jgi:beta-N-acetylhexosaminidase
MDKKNKTIDYLLGELSLEEKVAQLLVFGFTGPFIEPVIEDFIDKYGLGGLRTSPTYSRKFVRYLSAGSPGIENVIRLPFLREKMWDEDVKPYCIRPSEYAGLLNRIRRKVFERKYRLPLHFVIDYECGEGANYIPPGMLTLPAPMGFGRIGDTDLIKRASYAVGKQLKAIGFDMVHSPVVDVNTNPHNPEISTRSYSAEPEVVTNCARAALKGFHDAGVIACLKHFPGRGETEDDAHYGVSSVPLGKDAMYTIHLAPYNILCAEKVVPAIMPV